MMADFPEREIKTPMRLCKDTVSPSFLDKLEKRWLSPVKTGYGFKLISLVKNATEQSGIGIEVLPKVGIRRVFRT